MITKNQAKKIINKWKEIEDTEMSTEYLMARVCEWASIYFKFDVDAGHVADAFEMEEQWQNKNQQKSEK